jgi:hypothetical protein
MTYRVRPLSHAMSYPGFVRTYWSACAAIPAFRGS